MKVGVIVQNNSNGWDSRINLSNVLLLMVEIILKATTEVIRIRMVMVWSWKKINCSIRGDDAFWNLIAADVLHSWTIPRLGVKVDAVPGRLNQVNFNCNYPGLFYGQCSEICGANHRFIPICIESLSPKWFIKWIKSLI